MYEKTQNILKMAKESNTSVISFICMDYVMARSVVYAAEATNTPAIVMLYPEHVTVQKTTGFANYATMVKELAKEVNVPIGLHADHDFSYNAVMTTIDAGFESVMIDGSMNDLDTNIELTKRVTLKARELGVCVEGEIGHVGTASISDNMNTDFYTKADAAEKFCRETGVDSLAVSIGNAHGEYANTPHLDIKRLQDIHAATDVPLVLHGGSGIPDDQLMVAFSNGINKFNLGTDFLARYYDAVTSFVADYASDSDPVKIINLPEYVQAKLQPYLEERMRTLCRF
ncbi:fructose-bisphosphate aldolase class II [Lachnospiraceae bacterium PM6-15]|uniref:class II fructose-bisphosphate aldolase n=1 Tax=Ohessyouella blattaphilus TaxID=2949333 RepID=UPI003E241E03